MFYRFRSLISANIFAILVLFCIFAEAQRPDFNRVRTFDAEHYVIKTGFDRRKRIVFGETTITLKPIANNFRRIELDAEGLEFSSIVLLPKNIALDHRSLNGKVAISLDKPYSPADQIIIKLVYSAKPKKGVYFVNEIKRGNEVTRPAQVWTQGEPAETRHWFPSYDFPDDKATTEQFITVEKHEIAISNGIVRDVKANPDGTKTFHFMMPYPHSVYLTSFVVGNYKKIEEKYEQIPLSYYVYPKRTDLVPLAFGTTKDAMRVFEELTGMKYPFHKYDQTIVADLVFGGMENITATTMSDIDMYLAYKESTRPTVVDVVSHELAHSWFGNLVTNRNWAELWLNEGFATFMEAAFREKIYGRANYIRKIKSDVAVYIADDSHNTSKHGLFNTLADPENDDSMFDNITYEKAGAVIHTLREEIGDEAFWRAINRYLETHKFGNVETSDLQKVMEDSSKRDLGWFFDQWVYGSGYPKLDVGTVYSRGAKTVEISISQNQKSEALVPEVFILPLEIRLKSETGDKLVSAKLTKRDQNFTFNVDAGFTGIEIDPNEKIPVKTVKLQKMSVRSE